MIRWGCHNELMSEQIRDILDIAPHRDEGLLQA